MKLVKNKCTRIEALNDLHAYTKQRLYILVSIDIKVLSIYHYL